MIPRAVSVAPVRDLLLVGGGHSHVQVLRRLAMAQWPGVRVTLVSREVHTPYSGMLPGLISGHYRYDDVHIDLGRLCAAAGARLVAGAVTALDLDTRSIAIDGRPPLRFDVLSLNVGGAPGAGGAVLGASVLPVKPISGFLPRWESMRRALIAGAGAGDGATVAVVGGGAGGVEIALAIEHALRRDGIAGRVVLISAGARLLEGHHARVERVFRSTLAARQIEVAANFAVTQADDSVLVAADGRRIAATHVLWVTGVAAPAWLAASGLAVDDAGFVAVEGTLRSTSHPFVFGAGDVVALADPRPKAGVFAVRAGAVLTHNLRAALVGARLRRYRPQRRFLSLISTGGRYAVASRGIFCAQGAWVWRWKDRIDRRFMARFAVAPAQPQRATLPGSLAADAPIAERCGGCAAKIGGRALERVLARLDVPGKGELEIGIGDDAALLRVAGDRILLTVDGFPAMIGDLYRFGRICAHHALNDVYAMGGRPTAALALVTVELASEALMEEDLFQVMAGACDVLRTEGVALAGGHSSEGAALSLGFAVVGAAPVAPLHKAGLRVGDALVVTKAIGTGIVLAGAMHGRARAADVLAAVDAMDRSNAAALAVLLRHGAQGCTDVTGFGLLGHLGEMLRASRVAAVVTLERVPVLAGALALAGLGVESSLASSNARVLADFERGSGVDDAALRLLVDPQTSGGLLAGVEAGRAAACVAELRSCGYDAAVIGSVCAGVAGRGRIVCNG